MPRPIWSGAITFGLVSIPVKVYSCAVRDHSVHFHQLDGDTGSRIRYKKVAEKTGQEVAPIGWRPTGRPPLAPTNSAGPP